MVAHVYRLNAEKHHCTKMVCNYALCDLITARRKAKGLLVATACSDGREVPLIYL
jgi:hypothetical protein